jgi:hypothetical protein
MALTHVRFVTLRVEAVNDLPFVVLPGGEGGMMTA